MLFATWPEGLQFVVPSVAALALFAVLLWGLQVQRRQASPGAATALLVCQLVLLLPTLAAIYFAMIGIEAIGCAPDQYECPF